MYQIAGYVGRGRPLDWLIRGATLGPVSHCEIVCGDHWASSSWRDGGVRVTTIRPKPLHWWFVGLPDDVGAAAFDFIAAREGAPYDLIGALTGPTLGLRTEINGAWFCSEICARGLGMARPWTLSPTRIMREMSWLHSNQSEALSK